MTEIERGNKMNPYPSAPPLPTLEEIIRALKTVRQRDCGAHYCRYCEAGTKNNWQHEDYCLYAESVREAEAARKLVKQLESGALRVREEEGQGEQQKDQGAGLLPVDPSATVKTETLPNDEPEVITRTGPHPMQTLYDDPAWRQNYFSQFSKADLIHMLVNRKSPVAETEPRLNFRHMRDGVTRPCTLEQLLADTDRFALGSDTASWYVGALTEAIRLLIDSGPPPAPEPSAETHRSREDRER